MPKVKPSKKAASSSDSDSGPDDRKPAAKKSKRSEEDTLSWSLGKNRFVKLTEFKGKWYVNIREFYDNDGELKPGKKGIMLTLEQWQKVKDIVGDVDEAIKKNV